MSRSLPISLNVEKVCKNNKGVMKKNRKRGKTFQASTTEVDSDNDGEYENSDSTKKKT